ncbi:MAG: response regulator [Bdellovibrionota bacterium]
MTSLLLLTPDLKIASELETMCLSLGIRLRHVHSPEAAKQWLSMQTFDIFLVDFLAEPNQAVALLELAWKYSPILTGGVFSVHDPKAESWGATLIGAKVFFGPNALLQIHDFLVSYPKEISRSLEKHDSILLVEDLDSPREIVTTYIQSLGYRSVTATSDAETALKLLDEAPESYFCVVTDLHMPKMDGMQLTEQIRARAKTRFLPVVILTAYATPDNLLSCVKAGVSGFLAKPPKKKFLLKELEKAKRIVLFKQSPRLCEPKDAHLLEEALNRLKLQ